MITKRDTYDDQVPLYCETCGTDFTIEGYVKDIGDGFRVIPANASGDLCPDDYDFTVSWSTGGRKVTPSHDVSYGGS